MCFFYTSKLLESITRPFKMCSCQFFWEMKTERAELGQKLHFDFIFLLFPQGCPEAEPLQTEEASTSATLSTWPRRAVLLHGWLQCCPAALAPPCTPMSPQGRVKGQGQPRDGKGTVLGLLNASAKVMSILLLHSLWRFSLWSRLIHLP